VRAAVYAARLIDNYGSPIPAARIAYLLYPSDALYPPEDLRLGERLLLDCGLLAERDEHLYPSARLSELLALDEDACHEIVFERAVETSYEVTASASLPSTGADVLRRLIPDPDRREAFLLRLQNKFDQAQRDLLGARGEEAVVAAAVEELTEAGRDDLASRVRRVSQLSDDLGYDVVAPRFDGNRRLEVKTTGVAADELFRCFVSRNEADWGQLDPDWALVACTLSSHDEVELVGWCRASTLEPYLPTDTENGRWSSAELQLPVTLFLPGLPPLS
jgi:hypothetical protein